MLRGKIWKLLFKKFKGLFFLLFLLTFLVSCIPILVRFNLRTNLYKWEYRGNFYYLFGKFSVTEKVVNNKVYVNWTKLLLILFLLYFPLRIVFRLTFNFFQQHCQRKTQVYLTKKLINFAAKNKELVAQKTSEKVYILNRIVPEFSRQFFVIPLKLFEVLVDLGLEIISLVFLIKSSSLTTLLPLTITFLLANLIWLVLFYFLTSKLRKLNRQKKWNYQDEEKNQIRIFCENLGSSERILVKKSSPPTASSTLEEFHNLLDKNSSRISSSFLLSELTELPSLIIPGIAVLFLFLYYQIWLGGSGGLEWNEYFVAYNLQRILWEINRMFYWLFQISDFRHNYHQIEKFFK